MKNNPEKLPVIQSLWIGDELSIMEKLAIVSFLKNGHPFHLYAYKEIKGAPHDVMINDANRIIPAEKIFKYRDYDSYAGFANLFRYKLLLEKGGFWVDADVVCLKPFLFSSDYVFASEIYSITEEKVTTKQVTNCVIKVPAGSEVMEYCYRQSLARDPKELNWGETGPQLLSKAVLQEFKMGSSMVDPKVFCPVPFVYWQVLINEMGPKESEGLVARLASESFAIHLYQEMWRRNNIDKNASFSPDCIYEKLKTHYL